MSELEEFLSHRELRDRAVLVERFYRFLPQPLARAMERYLTPRHMRSMAPRFSFLRNVDESWTVRNGTKIVAQSRPLGELVGRLDKPVTIVATGPSAKDYPWDEVRDGKRFVIAVAGAPTLLKSVNIRPDLLVITDSRFAKYGIEHIRAAREVPMVTVMRAVSFLAERTPEELTNRPFAMIEKVNSWYGLPQLAIPDLIGRNERSGHPFVFADPFHPSYRVGWSHRPELGFFTAATVAYVSLQIAVGLGARDIEIVGMDLSSGARAYDEGDMAVPNTLVQNYEQNILPSFELMHTALLGSGVSVRNRSPVCPLPASLFS